MSKSDNWMTPPPLVDVLHERWKFTQEVCADANHRALPMLPYMGLDNDRDALINHWGTGTNFCNPPYSQLPAFVEKAAIEAACGALNILLIPAYTDTQYWQNIIDGSASEVYFLAGRLRFWDRDPSGILKPGKDTARFPSAVVVFSKYGMNICSTSYRCWDWKYELKQPGVDKTLNIM